MVESTLVRSIIDIAMFFGLYVILAMALNFQFGNGGVPNMGSAVSVAFGGYIVSAFILRLIFWIGQGANIELGPDWVYDNIHNVDMMTVFFKEHALLGISLFVLALTLGLVLGTLFGYIISFPAIKLQGTYLMITLIAMSEASQVIGRNYVPISGGTLGVRVPNIFSFYEGDRSLLLAIITLSIGIVVFFIFSTMINSPYGRLIRALRENETTLNSTGKNVTGIRRNLLMFSSGITSVVGVLIVFYFSYSTSSIYMMSTYTFWPWLMLLVGGAGNNAGTFLGALLVISIRRLIIIFKWELTEFFWFPVAFLENILLGALLLVTMIFKPNGLIPEKSLYIPGLKYYKLIRESAPVSWRVSHERRSLLDIIQFWRRKERLKSEE
ncbi:MAG: branched-chain amino acid ABC transporter permease [Dehalococcoidia bacterium]|nr:branched-chain amino acid ABC transporter permease [Dehalococcoidia bacterium]